MSAKVEEWKRREFVTRGPDPTVIVEWSKNGVTIAEFQQVYQAKGDVSKIDPFSELHQALERAYDAEFALQESSWEDQGGNPDAKIYGGA